MTDWCPGVCNAAWRRAVAGQNPGPGDPVPGDPVWCRLDAARIRRQLAELDILAALRAMTADGHREQATEPARGNGHQPSPSPAVDDLDELARWLCDWEDAYREVRGWATAPRHGFLADVRTEVIGWLCERLDGLLAAPFAVDFGLEVGQWHHRLSTMTKAGTGFRRGVVPCPNPACKLRLLGGRVGDGFLVCGNCGCRVLDDEYNRLVTAATRAVS